MSEGTAAVALPATSRLDERLRLAMLALLAMFLFTLPLVEAPKNLAAALFMVLWLVRAVVTRDAGGPWNRYDTVFALALGTAMVSGFAGYAGDLGGVFRVFLVSWIISRSSFGERDFRPLAAAACLGLLLAIPFAAVPFLRGTRQFFELPSVGQVNQSALYLAILAGAASGWWFQQARSHGADTRARTGFAVSATIFWAALLVSASRAAILAAALFTAAVVGCIAWQSRSDAFRRLLVRAGATMAVLVMLVAGLTALSPGLSDNKLDPQRIVDTYSMHHRMQHWRIAYEGWRQRPWVGWGPDAFQQIKVEDVCTWRHQRGEDCDPAQYVATKHAHSLYLATLVERGVIGVLAMAALFAVWAWSLLRSLGTAAQAPLWVASGAGLAVVLVGGVFNTTLRVEHGSLAVGFFGLWIAAHARPLAKRAAG